MRAVKTRWWHEHKWMLVEPEEHREAPVDATQHTVLWQQQEKVFCRCGSVMWQPRRDYRHSKIERWELCS